MEVICYRGSAKKGVTYSKQYWWFFTLDLDKMLDASMLSTCVILKVNRIGWKHMRAGSFTYT